MTRYLFYSIGAEQALACATSSPPGYRIRIWQPRRDGLPSAPLPFWPFTIWWLFDRLGVFANRNAGVLAIEKDGLLVHRSLVTPRWHRFPDMARRDLQIGDTWTHPDHRGLGLARAAVAAIHAHWAGGYDRMWYLVDDGNRASVRVIEVCGYRLAGVGKRTRPFGLALFGKFVIEEAGAPL